MTTSISTILGRQPIPGSISYESDIRGVAAQWTSRCPVTRANTRYVDTTGGNDSNNGLTPVTPWKTINKVNLNLAPDVNIRFLCGNVIESTSPIILNGGSISTYGDGPKVIIRRRSTFLLTGTIWTNVSGNVFSTPVASEVAYVNDNIYGFSPLSFVTNLTECQNRVSSWFWLGGLLYMNLGGANPSLTSWDILYTGAINVATEASAIVIDKDGSRVDGFEVRNIGTSRTLGNQIYGIKSTLVNSELGVVTNCDCYANRQVNIGHYTDGSGGRLLVQNCRVGGIVDVNSANIRSFAVNGANELIVLDSRSKYGAIPDVSGSNTSTTGGSFAHATATAPNKISASHIIGCILESSDFANKQLGFSNAAPASNDDHENARSVYHRCTVHRSNDTNTVPIYDDNIYTCCRIYIKPIYNATAQGIVAGDRIGWMMGCIYDIDWSNMVGQTTSYSIIRPTSAVAQKVRIVNSLIVFRDAGSVRVSWNELLNGASVAMDSVTVNNAWLAINSTAAYAGLAGIGSINTSTSHNNAQQGFIITNGANEFGHLYWVNNTNILDPTIIQDQLDNRLAGLTDSVYDYIKVDIDGNKLVEPGRSVGPYGYIEQSGALASSGSSASVNDIIAAIEARFASSIDQIPAIKTKTDSLTFNNNGHVECDLRSISGLNIWYGKSWSDVIGDAHDVLRGQTTRVSDVDTIKRPNGINAFTVTDSGSGRTYTTL